MFESKNGFELPQENAKVKDKGLVEEIKMKNNKKNKFL